MSFLRGTALALALLAGLTVLAGAGADVKSIDIPLFVDTREAGQVQAFFGGDGALLSVDGARFVQALRQYLLPERLAELSRRAGPSGRLSPEAILACGIDFVFDTVRLEAHAGIPAARRPVIPLDLAPRQETDPEKTVPAAASSGYLNLLAGLAYREGGPLSVQRGWQPPVFDFDGALRAFGTVLEGAVTYRGQPAVPWQRQDLRLVYDRPEERERFSFGDVNYGLSGFQSSQRMGGLAAVRSLELQRNSSSAPAAAAALLLERSSRVDIWVNGQRVQTLQLAPGRYDIRNFPLAPGTNDILLHITDEVGRVQDVRFPFVFDSALLGRGEQDFSYVAGFLSRVTPGGRSYDVNAPAFSVYHDAGLTDQFTAGASAQGSRRQQMYGAECRWATGAGTLRADVAASRADFAAAGSAARLQYNYANTVPRGDIHSWTAAATYRSRAFTALGDTAASNPYALELGAVYSRRLLWNVLGTLGAGRQIGRAGQPDGENADLTLYRSFGSGMLASLSFSRRYPVVNNIGNRVFLSFTMNFGRLDTVTATRDSAAGAARLDWRHSASRRVLAVDSGLILTHDRSSDTEEGNLHYRGYRFSADTTGSFAQGRAHAAPAAASLNLNFGTALAFAGGRVALSRPIADSFVLIAPHPSLSGQAIEVNVNNGVPEAVNGPLGPAVLPELLSYGENAVSLSAPHLPLWTDLGPQPRYVYPPYRSGTLLIAGTGAVVIRGLLADTAGRPLPSEPGDLEQLDDTVPQARGFFTDAAGRFAVEGLKPGRFRLTLRNYPASPFLLTVPPGTSGNADAGTLRLPPSRECSRT